MTAEDPEHRRLYKPAIVYRLGSLA